MQLPLPPLPSLEWQDGDFIKHHPGCVHGDVWHRQTLPFSISYIWRENPGRGQSLEKQEDDVGRYIEKFLGWKI